MNKEVGINKEVKGSASDEHHVSTEIFYLYYFHMRRTEFELLEKTLRTRDFRR